MTTLREAAQQALEALEMLTDCYDDSAVGLEIDAIKALRAALADHNEEVLEMVEPVAWMGVPVMPGRYKEAVFCSDKNLARQWDYSGHLGLGRLIVTPLYTAPQPIRRLTDEEIAQALAEPLEPVGSFEYWNAVEGWVTVEPDEVVDGRAKQKMLRAALKTVDPQYKDDPEVMFALGWEAGFNARYRERP
jgi:hypothetical protein